MYCVVGLILISISYVFAATYSVGVIQQDAFPVISYLDRSSTYFQAFNPSWVAASPKQPRSGLLIRAQNCSSTPGKCVRCPGSGSPSVLLFSEMVNPEPFPQFKPVSANSVAFEPATDTEKWGTEDPRLVLLPNGTYILFYTQYGPANVILSTATTQTPWDKNSWKRNGPIFPGSVSKSGALLVRDTAPHYLLWGDSSITLAVTNDFITYKNVKTMIAPRKGFFDSGLVESGPPPMKLSTGDYIFFHNSADDQSAYHPGYLILDGKDPSQILARSSTPLFNYTNLPWAAGTAPYLCNVGNVIFLEAAYPIEGTKDTFRVFFGASDAVIGSAVIQVRSS